MELGFLDRLRNPQTQSLIDRIDELRKRIVRCLLVVAAVFGVCFALAGQIFAALRAPLLDSLPEGSKTLNFTGPMDVFASYVRVSLLLATVITAPLLFYQTWLFLKPALPKDQQKMMLPYFSASMVLFVGGVSFCYYVMLPLALTYLLGLGGAGEVAKPVIMIEEYVSLTTFLLLAFGGVFQLPLVLVILESLGLVTHELLAGNRRFVIVGIFIVAAVATPTPDPLSQIAMATPMYIMYEGALIVIKLRGRKRVDRTEGKAEG